MKVYALPEERQLIAQRAAMTGLSVSAYLLALGCGHQPKSPVGQEQIQAVIRLHAALVKANELLEAYVRDEKRVVSAEPIDVHSVLAQVRETQAIVQRLARQAIGPAGPKAATRKTRSAPAHDRQEGLDASREEVQLRGPRGLFGQRSGQ